MEQGWIRLWGGGGGGVKGIGGRGGGNPVQPHILHLHYKFLFNTFILINKFTSETILSLFLTKPNPLISLSSIHL